MLQQILKDMYIEPEVLGALNEEQKRTLFLKMRQEQVRRWEEHEEKLEKEQSCKPKAKTAPNKSVSWQLGRDGDVQVLVIGEVEEFKTSKIFCSGFGGRKAADHLNHSCEQVSSLKSNLANRTPTEQSGRENLPPKASPGVQLNLKENSEEVRTQPPPQVSVCEQKPASPVESVREAEEEAAGSGDATKDSAPSSFVSHRPHQRVFPKITSVLQSLAPRDVQDKANPLSVTTRLHPNQPPEPNTAKGRDFRVTAASKRALSVEEESAVGGNSCSGRGRVAELMKTFSVTCDSAPSQTPPRTNKPPVPIKPSHLQLRPSPKLR
ncbi:uncharacterized protein LOC143482261 [Brachyhypopomus gauderio]|uniref:uncharacterized protein LOC143482261 n=1 Tax=Brachyhypopomus gauderio TaxID=698409 RepID=UPI004042F1F2